MSYRSAFTSEYIYCEADYKKLRGKASNCGNSKYLAFAPPCRWGTNEMPILQGKVGSLAMGMEYEEIREFLQGVRTQYTVSFVIIPEGHEDGKLAPICKVVKHPDGEVEIEEYKRSNDYTVVITREEIEATQPRVQLNKVPTF
jgi:hypothetical protein